MDTSVYGSGLSKTVDDLFEEVGVRVDVFSGWLALSVLLALLAAGV